MNPLQIRPAVGEMTIIYGYFHSPKAGKRRFFSVTRRSRSDGSQSVIQSLTDWWLADLTDVALVSDEDDEDYEDDEDIHGKNVWCCGDGYFGQKKIAEKVRKSRQNVNRDKSA